MRRFSVIVALFSAASLAGGAVNAAILTGSQTTNAGQNMSVDLTIDTILETVALTMTGPENVWFGVAFEPFNHPTADSSYSVNVLGGASAPGVEEWSLGRFGPGVQLPDTLSVDSNTVSAGVRTVQLSGPRAGANYTFPDAPKTMDIGWAFGSGGAFAIHAGRGETTLELVPGQIPEPSTLLLLGVAGLGLGRFQRRR
jgi:hypothetical protein